MPPQILRIKRKRAVEPVDSLYVETARNPEDHKRRRGPNGEDYIYNRVPASSSDGQEVAKPSDESSAQSTPLASQGLAGQSTTTHKAPHTHETPASAPRRIAASKPRRFHLSRDSISVLSSKRKRNSIYQPDVAVFVESVQAGEERRPEAKRPRAAEDQVPTKFKRAGRSSAPKRAPDSTKRPPAVKDNEREAYKYDFMLHWAAETGDVPPPEAFAAQHQQPESDEEDKDEHDETEASDMDYVYDTYVRHENPNSASAIPSSTMDTATPPSDPNGKCIGYLIVSEEDEELFETYGNGLHESSSEADWDSEQDDENAENYYGADYPEDEVASDDEYGRGAYKYRHGSEDEEEYLDDYETGSEKYPWQDSKVLRWQRESDMVGENDEIGEHGLGDEKLSTLEV